MFSLKFSLQKLTKVVYKYLKLSFYTKCKTQKFIAFKEMFKQYNC